MDRLRADYIVVESSAGGFGVTPDESTGKARGIERLLVQDEQQ